ncbi:MAG TPA: hypothetical protein VGM51_00680 [Armatimonadota bacterium]|jgi:hypothetical protein
MKSAMRALALGCVAWAALGAAARAETVTVPKGTQVVLVFDQALDSRHVKEGAAVRLHVRDVVNSNGVSVLNAGTPVTGLVTKVVGRKHYGVNAKLYLGLNPVTTTFGQPLTLEAASQGKVLGGKKSGEAAGATVGGAMVAGPIGLVGGYFVHGKSVKIKPGDTLIASTSVDTDLTR